MQQSELLWLRDDVVYLGVGGGPDWKRFVFHRLKKFPGGDVRR